MHIPRLQVKTHLTKRVWYNSGAAAGSADPCLLNLDAALHISHGVSQTVNHDSVPRLHLKSFALLEELARIYTYKLVVDVAAKKFKVDGSDKKHRKSIFCD